MSRIEITFRKLAQQQRKALIPFITAGDPDLPTTLELMHTLVRAGADVIELGVPFSDPMADGPIIQRASERALAEGVCLADILECVRAFRLSNDTTPIVLMGYANPIEQMGVEKFVVNAANVGVDGVLVVDYPPEECSDFVTSMRLHHLDPIFLLAPTSTDARIQRVAQLASGFLYYVSLKGVTGSDAINLDEVERQVRRIKQYVHVPIAVGFGIRDAVMAERVAKISDAVVVGSRIVQEVELFATSEPKITLGEMLSCVYECTRQLGWAVHETARHNE